MLTEFQKRKLALGFYKLDTTKDGYLAEDDIIGWGKNIAQLMGLQPDSEEYTRIVTIYRDVIWVNFFLPADLDGDGKHTLEEFWTACDQLFQREGFTEIGMEGSRAMYDSVDLDGNGTISLSEYTLYLKALGVAEEHAELAFSKLDLDDNEQISREEFSQAALQFWSSDDKNAAGNWFYGPF